MECPLTQRTLDSIPEVDGRHQRSVSVCSELTPTVAELIATWAWIERGARKDDKPSRNPSSTASRPHSMGTAVRPAKTSPGPRDAFGDVDVFVDEVLAELTAMARDGTRPQRSGPMPPLAGSVLRKAVMAIWQSGASVFAACSGGPSDSSAISPSARCTDCSPVGPGSASGDGCSIGCAAPGGALR
jgi:hypothetical protein